MSGKLTSGDTVFNNTAEKPEKVGTIYVLKGKKQEPVDFLEAGDIGALAKLVYTNTNDTLSSPDYKLDFEKIDFPKPVISYAVTAAKDEEKVIQGLIKMQDEDATFKVEKNIETGDVLISGLGEAQLDIMCKRVKNKLGLDITWQEPRVAYRETIRKTAEAEGKHKKQSGAQGSTAMCSSVSSRVPKTANSSSSTQSSAARCPVSSSPQSKRVCARQSRRACSQGILSSTLKLRFTTENITP